MNRRKRISLTVAGVCLVAFVGLSYAGQGLADADKTGVSRGQQDVLESLVRKLLPSDYTLDIRRDEHDPLCWRSASNLTGVTFFLKGDTIFDKRDGKMQPCFYITFMPQTYDGKPIGCSEDQGKTQVLLFPAKMFGMRGDLRVYACQDFGYGLPESGALSTGTLREVLGAEEATTGTVRVAAIQCPSIMGKTENNVRNITNLVRQAAAQGAKIVVLPECAVQGYFDPTTLTSWSTSEGGGRAVRGLAEPVPGPITAMFSRTEFGNIGLMICYDFHTLPPLLAKREADIVLYSVGWYGPNEANWFGKAFTTRVVVPSGFHVVAANWSSATAEQAWPGRGHSCVITRTGKILAMSTSVCGNDIMVGDLEIRKRPDRVPDNKVRKFADF